MGGHADRSERILSVILVLATCVIAGTLLAREVRNGQVGTGSEEMAPRYHPEWKDWIPIGHLMGKESADVTIIEFGDFQCPFCSRFAAHFDSLTAEYRDHLALVYVHYPLTNIHPFALPAARAAECAAEQSRFRPYHDALFATQDSLGLKPWVSYAVDAGIPDIALFTECIEHGGPFLRIEKGIELAENLGVRGTPSLVVNRWQYPRMPHDTILENAIVSLLGGEDP